MKNNNYLVEKFEELQKNGVPAFLCGNTERGGGTLAYLAVTPEGDNVVKLIINCAFGDDDILVGMIDVGENMICEFGKYAMLFDEDAYCHIYNFISLCDKRNATFANRRNIDMLIKRIFKTHQDKTREKLEILTNDMLVHLSNSS